MRHLLQVFLDQGDPIFDRCRIKQGQINFTIFLLLLVAGWDQFFCLVVNKRLHSLSLNLGGVARPLPVNLLTAFFVRRALIHLLFLN